MSVETVVPAQPAPAAPDKDHTWILVVSILALVFSFIPVIGVVAWPLSVVGLTAGLVYKYRTGWIMSSAALTMCVIWLILTVASVH